MEQQKHSVLITGGSKGIGLSIAKVFARETDRPLVLLARKRKELEQARTQCLAEGASKVEIIVADLVDHKTLSTIDFDTLNIDILVNNAGSYLYRTLQETTPEEFERQFKINTLGAFNITQQILPSLHKKERGLIVNICSRASLVGFDDSGAYTMSKHALLGYTRSLRKELINTKIAVSAINLGQTYSTSWKEIDVNPDDLIDPEDVGQLILCLSQLSVRSVAEEIILSPQGGDINPV